MMDLENLDAVKTRIEEIRRRFVGMQETYNPSASGASRIGAYSFADAMRRAQSAGHIPCPAEYEPAVARAADRHDVDPAIVKAVMRVESGFRQSAVSRAGAQGLMQLMPGTARALGVDPTDPEQNIEGGTRYLKQQMDRFGSLELALAAYNAGPGSVQRFGGIPPYAETRKYVSDVMDSIGAYSSGR